MQKEKGEIIKCVTCKDHPVLKKRKTAPRTAHQSNKHLFDYFQCPVCKKKLFKTKK